MTKAVVLLFLLDSLPDFNNVINTTLQKFQPVSFGVTCDSTITAPVLQVIGKKLNLTIDSVENLQHIEFPKRHNHKFQELSPESVNNVGFQDNSIQESNEYSIEKRPNYVEHVYSDHVKIDKDSIESMADLNKVRNVSEDESTKTSNFTKHNYHLNASKKDDVSDFVVLKSNMTDVTYSRQSAPFLVAIFETVGNVTAQTCGGVVLAPRWVLTAASCVNVLGSFYSNSSNETTDNYYSIVAGAKNPLKDGTVHQVSKIYLHPATNRSKLKSWFNSMEGSGASSPSLALLEVEPGIKSGAIGMMERIWDGAARIYGWALRQNQTGFEMAAISSPAKRLSSAECYKMFGVLENNTTMCLSVNETASKHTRMNSGCPVVSLQGGRLSLVAVSLADGTRPLLAIPLSAHRDWLLKLTTDDDGDYREGSNKIKK